MKKRILLCFLILTAPLFTFYGTVHAQSPVTPTVVGGCVGTTAVCHPLNADGSGNVFVSGTSFTPCYIQGGTGTTNDTSNHANCKASAGIFLGARAINTTGTIAYLRMYNLAINPTCSSATGFVESIPIPANTTGAGFIDVLSNFPYTAGIGYCVTGTGANNDNDAPPAGIYVTIALQ